MKIEDIKTQVRLDGEVFDVTFDADAEIVKDYGDYRIEHYAEFDISNVRIYGEEGDPVTDAGTIAKVTAAIDGQEEVFAALMGLKEGPDDAY